MSEPTAPPAPARTCVPVDWSCDTDLRDSLSEDVLARAEALAGSTLRALTAYQIGGCPVVLRPCAQGCAGSSYVTGGPVIGGHYGALGGLVGPWWAHIEAGQWVNTACGCATGTGCSCSAVSEVVLPAFGFVSSVSVDGVELDVSAWRVDNGNLLVRTDGQKWPKCQDMAAPLDQAGTFGVVFTPGAEPDGLVAFAAGLLAAEFAKACMGGACALPDGVRQVTRQGVTWDIQTSMFDDGLTGITAVDAVVRIYNPNGLRTAPRVWSPGQARARITTQYPQVTP